MVTSHVDHVGKRGSDGERGRGGRTYVGHGWWWVVGCRGREREKEQSKDEDDDVEGGTRAVNDENEPTFISIAMPHLCTCVLVHHC
jgi:hypothetical protein